MAQKLEVDVKKLLEAGAHFGHKTSRWHPAMRPFIHGKRGDTHIIDLTKTAENLQIALDAVTEKVAKGGQVLVVSTKRQAKDTISKLAEDTGMPFVVNRWLGGMLTNKKTIGERIKYLKKQEERMATGELASKYSKLEVQNYQEEIDEMNVLYGGVKDLAGNPAIVFVVDILNDKNAVAESEKLGVPVVGLVDTNGDPRTIKYPVPCNDDALKTIELVCEYMRQAIEIGKASRKSDKPAEATTAPVAKEVSATIEKPATDTKEETKAEAKETPKTAEIQEKK